MKPNFFLLVAAIFCGTFLFAQIKTVKPLAQKTVVTTPATKSTTNPNSSRETTIVHPGVVTQNVKYDDSTKAKMSVAVIDWVYSSAAYSGEVNLAMSRYQPQIDLFNEHGNHVAHWDYSIGGENMKKDEFGVIHYTLPMKIDKNSDAFFYAFTNDCKLIIRFEGISDSAGANTPASIPDFFRINSLSLNLKFLTIGFERSIYTSEYWNKAFTKESPSADFHFSLANDEVFTIN